MISKIVDRYKKALECANYIANRYQSEKNIDNKYEQRW